MIGIVYMLNPLYAPFLEKYTEILMKNEVDYEVIYWDRLGIDENLPYKSICYKRKSKLKKKKVYKFLDFLGFRKFLKKNINNEKYEKLIVLTTLTGILMADVLLKDFKNKYIYDIRDYTFENNRIFKFVESNIIKNSFITSISSEGFKNFLNSSYINKYVISHNMIFSEYEKSLSMNFEENYHEERINVVFLGSVRHFELDKIIAEKLGKDNRFQLFYHGNGPTSKILEKYCEIHNLKVIFTGKFERRQKAELLRTAHIINAYYDNEKFINRFAMPNKFYDSLIYKKPFWANPYVFSGEYSIEKGIGLKADLMAKDFSTQLYEAYNNHNYNQFLKNCDLEMKKILKEEISFEKQLIEFINTK